ncbi:MAG TPA: superinfection immunity protein [Hanamia sp.]|nr:superinfection immunity protein [Hanamia sp.]
MVIFLLVLLAIFLLVIYFLPTIVASNRYHPNKLPIFIINLFLGFTLLGWVISLAWACSRISDNDMVKINEEKRKQREKIEKLYGPYPEQKIKSEV